MQYSLKLNSNHLRLQIYRAYMSNRSDKVISTLYVRMSTYGKNHCQQTPTHSVVLKVTTLVLGPAYHDCHMKNISVWLCKLSHVPLEKVNHMVPRLRLTATSAHQIKNQLSNTSRPRIIKIIRRYSNGYLH